MHAQPDSHIYGHGPEPSPFLQKDSHRDVLSTPLLWLLSFICETGSLYSPLAILEPTI